MDSGNDSTSNHTSTVTHRWRKKKSRPSWLVGLWILRKTITLRRIFATVLIVSVGVFLLMPFDEKKSPRDNLVNYIAGSSVRQAAENPISVKRSLCSLLIDSDLESLTVNGSTVCSLSATEPVVIAHLNAPNMVEGLLKVLCNKGRYGIRLLDANGKTSTCLLPYECVSLRFSSTYNGWTKL